MLSRVDIPVYRFGNPLEYQPWIKNMRILNDTSPLYKIYYNNIIIIFTSLEEINDIDFNKLKYGRLFVIINSNIVIENLRAKFAQNIPNIDLQYLYILNDLHTKQFIFDDIKNNLLKPSFYSNSYFFIVKNFTRFGEKRTNIEDITV